MRKAIDDFDENENGNEDEDDELDFGNNVGNGGNGVPVIIFLLHFLPLNKGILRVNAEEGDILQAKVDAIVNPAKASLSPGKRKH